MKTRTAQYLIRFWLTTYLCLALSSCSTHPPLTTTKAASVPLEAVMGNWYIIAHFPYFFENGKIATRVEYRQRPDGKFDDIFYFKEQDFSEPEQSYQGTAVNLDPNSNRVWASTFLWPLSFEWHIIAMTPQAEAMLIGHESRNYAWIMARSSAIDNSLLKSFKNKLSENGFDVEKLASIPQPKAPKKFIENNSEKDYDKNQSNQN